MTRDAFALPLWIRNFARAIYSVVWLWAGRAVAMGLIFLTQVILARALGISGYGEFVGAFAVANLLSAFAQFGIPPFWQRAFGREGWDARRWLAPSFSLVPLSLAASFAVALTVGLFAGFEFNTAGLVAWLWPLAPAQVGLSLVISRFQLEERYRAVALADVSRQLLLFATAAAVWQWDLGFTGVVWGFGAAAIVLCSYSAWNLHTMVSSKFRLVGHGPERPQNTRSPRLRFSDVAKRSWPFAGVSIAFSVFFQSDLILLRWLASPADAAIYGATVAVLTGAYQLPVIIYGQFMLPKIHRWAEHDPKLFESMFRRGVFMMTSLGVAAAVGLALVGPVLVSSFFGSEFGESASLLRWMAVVVPISFVAAALASTFVTVQHKKKQLLYISGAAVLNIVLNIILVPTYGYEGAGIATIAAEATVLALYIAGSRKHQTLRGSVANNATSGL